MPPPNPDLVITTMNVPPYCTYFNVPFRTFTPLPTSQQSLMIPTKTMSTPGKSYEAFKSPSTAKPYSVLQRPVADRTKSTKTLRHHHPHLHYRNQEKVLPIGRTSQSSVTTEAVKTPDQSQNVSRATSLIGPGSGSEDVASIGYHRDKRVVTDAELAEEEKKSALRTMQLHHELSGLIEVSNRTARRLDSSYYSVLEKLGSLQNTLASLRELSTRTQNLNGEFKSDSQPAVADVETQLATYEGFDGQERRVVDLANRVRTGCQQIRSICQRMDNVREKVEYWERAEAEWQENVRKRLQGLWVVMTLVSICLVGLVAAFYYKPFETDTLLVTDSSYDSSPTALPELERMRNAILGNEELAIDVHDTIPQRMQNRAGQPEHQGEDPRLRLLDGL